MSANRAHPIWRHRAFWTSLVAVLLVVSAPAVAEEDEARRQQAKTHFEQGKAAFETGEYQKALEHYQGAYEIMPLAGLLFNIGQCHRNLGQDQKAIETFKLFLEKAPSAPNRDGVKRLVAELEAKQAKGASTGTATAAKPAPTTQPAQEQTQQQSGSDTVDDLNDDDLDSVIGGAPQADPKATAAVAATATTQPTPARRGPVKPIYKQWWFWTAVGVAALAGGVTAMYFGLRDVNPPFPPSNFPVWELPDIKR